MPALQALYSVDGDLLGFEALARFEVNGQSVSPGEAFAAGADPTLVSAALLQCAPQSFAAAGGRGFLSLNMPPSALLAPGFVDKVVAVRAATGADVVIEILETEPLTHPDLPYVVRELQAAGARVALDDVGDGYAVDPVHITTLKPDLVKVSSVVWDHAESRTRELLAAYAKAAQEVGATTLVEGVETTAQLTLSAEAGFDAAQGFLLARPQFHVADIPANLRDHVDTSEELRACLAHVAQLRLARTRPGRAPRRLWGRPTPDVARDTALTAEL